jgi:protein TonB
MANWSNEVTSERNELVFENRNREYGAYLIRRDYGKIVAIAGGSATIAVLFFFFIFNLANREEVKPVKKEKITEVVLKDAPPVNKDAPPPPPPPQVKMLQFTTPVVTKDDVAPPPPQPADTAKIGDHTQDGTDDAAPEVITPVVDQAVEQTTEQVFTFAEVMPTFPGDAFQTYLKNNEKFPFAEKDQGKSGVVYISFVVEKDGSISTVKAVKEVPGAPGFTKEAIRVISQMPKWSPGMMNGHPVKIEITQPVRFVLQ